MFLPPFTLEVINLHVLRNIDKFRYNNRGKSFVYGIKVHPVNMIYIGSTWDSPRRFRQHLITGAGSNPHLQTAIIEHGLESLSVYVFEYINTNRLPQAERKPALLALEQKYINLIPTDRQYNLINSSCSK